MLPAATSAAATATRLVVAVFTSRAAAPSDQFAGGMARRKGNEHGRDSESLEGGGLRKRGPAGRRIVVGSLDIMRRSQLLDKPIGGLVVKGRHGIYPAHGLEHRESILQGHQRPVGPLELAELPRRC